MAGIEEISTILGDNQIRRNLEEVIVRAGQTRDQGRTWQAQVTGSFVNVDGFFANKYSELTRLDEEIAKKRNQLRILFEPVKELEIIKAKRAKLEMEKERLGADIASVRVVEAQNEVAQLLEKVKEAEELIKTLQKLQEQQMNDLNSATVRNDLLTAKFEEIELRLGSLCGSVSDMENRVKYYLTVKEQDLVTSIAAGKHELEKINGEVNTRLAEVKDITDYIKERVQAIDANQRLKRAVR